MSEKQQQYFFLISCCLLSMTTGALDKGTIKDAFETLRIPTAKCFAYAMQKAQNYSLCAGIKDCPSYDVKDGDFSTCLIALGNYKDLSLSDAAVFGQNITAAIERYWTDRIPPLEEVLGVKLNKTQKACGAKKCFHMVIYVMIKMYKQHPGAAADEMATGLKPCLPYFRQVGLIEIIFGDPRVVLDPTFIDFVKAHEDAFRDYEG